MEGQRSGGKGRGVEGKLERERKVEKRIEGGEKKSSQRCYDSM